MGEDGLDDTESPMEGGAHEWVLASRARVWLRNFAGSENLILEFSRTKLVGRFPSIGGAESRRWRQRISVKGEWEDGGRMERGWKSVGWDAETQSWGLGCMRGGEWRVCTGWKAAGHKRLKTVDRASLQQVPNGFLYNIMP